MPCSRPFLLVVVAELLRTTALAAQTPVPPAADTFADVGAEPLITSALDARDSAASGLLSNEATVTERTRCVLEADPGLARTGNPEEDRLLADVADRNATERRCSSSSTRAPICRRGGLDDGTPLHQAAWSGQPADARILVEAGAPLEVFDGVHKSSPIGWAAHGSRYSGGAEERQEAYVGVARILLDAGSSLRHSGDADGDGRYYRRLPRDASAAVREVLEAAG